MTWNVLTEEHTKQASHIEANVQQDGTLTVQNVPLRAGEKVEVIILVRATVSQTNHYPLRNLPVRYNHTTEPVAEEDWETA